MAYYVLIVKEDCYCEEGGAQGNLQEVRCGRCDGRLSVIAEWYAAAGLRWLKRVITAALEGDHVR